jgi:heterodisulfide reductase subunit B
MKYGFYLGCIVPYRVPSYEISTRRIAKEFGIELVDIDDFSCCGFPIMNVNREAALLAAARNLCLAEEKGLKLCTICNACAGVLGEANKELKENKELRDEINKKLARINHKFEGTTEVKHFARVLYEDVGTEAIKEKVVKGLETLKVASHYGCHYLKPSSLYNNGDDPENPTSLDELIEATGAHLVDYQGKIDCCGNVIIGIDEKISLAMAREKLAHIKDSGAEAMVLICPACGVQFDTNQRMVESAFDVHYGLPIFYYPQLLGLALGIDPKELGLHLNRVKTTGLLSKLGGKQ